MTRPYNKAHYEAHKDEINAKSRERYASSDALKATKKAYRDAHKEEAKAYMQEYSASHKDRKRETNIKWRVDHREELLKKKGEYYNSHKDECSEKMKLWNATHKKEKAVYHTKRQSNWRETVLKHYGGACVKCGNSNFNVLEIDHINGGGRKHKSENGGNNYHFLIKNNYPIGFQVLCANCNRKKVILNNECESNKISIPTLNKKVVWRDTHKIEYWASRKILRLKNKTKAINHFGGTCIKCGEKDIDVLQLDHVNGDGAKHRNEIGGNKIYHWLIKNNFPETYPLQVLCANCNREKQRLNREYKR